MKMRKKKLLIRKRGFSPDWYNYFFKPLTTEEIIKGFEDYMKYLWENEMASYGK